MSSLAINKYYNITLYPNTVLGTSFKNVKLVSILDYNIALKFSNVELIQKQILPYLPPGSSTNHHNYIYYLFSYKDSHIVIANEWIIPSSIEEVNSLTQIIELYNITTDQMNVIKDQLRLLGISFKIM